MAHNQCNLNLQKKRIDYRFYKHPEIKMGKEMEDKTAQVDVKVKKRKEKKMKKNNNYKS